MMYIPCRKDITGIVHMQHSYELFAVSDHHKKKQTWKMFSE